MYIIQESDFNFEQNIARIRKENKVIWTLSFVKQLENEKLKQIWVMLNLVDILNTHKFTENEYACVDFEFKKLQNKVLKLKI